MSSIKFRTSEYSSTKSVSMVRFGSIRVGKVVIMDRRGIAREPYVLAYPLDFDITHGTLTGGSAMYFDRAGKFKIEPEKGYLLPNNRSTITVSNASIQSYDSTTGELVLKDPTFGTDSVYVTAPCVLSRFKITVNMNDTGTYGGESAIDYGGSSTVTVQPGYGRVLPEQITCTGVERYTYDRDKGEIVVIHPTSDVVISVTCPKAYKVRTTISGGTATPASISVVEGGSVTVNITPDIDKNAPPEITVNETTGTSGSGHADWVYTVSGVNGKVELSNVTGICDIIVVCGDKQALIAPTISIEGDMLTITNQDPDWSIVKKYRIYTDGENPVDVSKST